MEAIQNDTLLVGNVSYLNADDIRNMLLDRHVIVCSESAPTKKKKGNIKWYSVGIFNKKFEKIFKSHDFANVIYFSDYLSYYSKPENEFEQIHEVLECCRKNKVENFVINLIKQNYAQINNYYQMIINNLDNYNISKSHGHKDMKNKDIYKFPQSLSLDSNKSNTIIKSIIISNFFFDAFKSLNSYNISDLKIFYYSYLIKEFMDKKRNNILKRKVINYQKYKNGYFRLLSNNTRLNKSIKNYLPPIKSTHKYSLIINLDALIFVQNKFDKLNSTQLRPGLIQFLKEMKQFYELI